MNKFSIPLSIFFPLPLVRFEEGQGKSRVEAVDETDRERENLKKMKDKNKNESDVAPPFRLSPVADREPLYL